MKRKNARIIISVAILISIVLCFVIADEYEARNSLGFYRSLTGKIYCSDRSSCIHEIGHKTDDDLDWISKTDDWQKTVDYYRIMIYYYPETRDTMSHDIEFFYGVGWKRFQGTNIFGPGFWNGWGGYTELYAYILQLSDGKKENMPEEFHSFYNWERINELMAVYENME
jgi:hypothetical protein